MFSISEEMLSQIRNYINNTEQYKKWLSIANNVVYLCENKKVNVSDIDYNDLAIQVANSKLFNNDLYRVIENIPINLTNAVFDDEKKVVTLRIIQGDNTKEHDGWSLNNVYYSKEKIQELIPFLSKSKKMYMNHETPTHRKEGVGRDIREWTATISESWENDAGAYARASIENNHNAWIYDSMKKNPEEVGVSIDAYAEVKKYKDEKRNKEGLSLEKWVWLNSSDFVSQAGAKGGVVAIGENLKNDSVIQEINKILENFDMNNQVKKYVLISEGLKDKLRKMETKEKFYNIFFTGIGVVREIIDANEEESFIKEKVGILFDEMKELVLELPLKDLQESFTYFYNNLIKIKENNNNNLGGDSNLMSVEEIKSLTYDQLKQSGNTLVIDGLKEEMKLEFEKKTKESESIIEDIKKKNIELEEKLKGIEEIKRIEENKKKVILFLATNKIVETDLPPSYISDLIKKDNIKIDEELKSLKEHWDKKDTLKKSATTKTDNTDIDNRPFKDKLKSVLKN